MGKIVNNELNYPVKVLWKYIFIIEFFLQNKFPMSIAEISKQLGMSPSNIHRMLSTLKRWGYVEQILDIQNIA